MEKATHNWTMYREGKHLEESFLNGISLSNPPLNIPGPIFPLILQDLNTEEEIERFLEPEVMDDSKESVFSRHNRTDGHTNSQRQW